MDMRQSAYPLRSESEELKRALLATLGVLDTGPERAFDGLTRAAALATGCPAAALSFSDGARRWFKSQHGLPSAGGVSAAAPLRETDAALDAPFDWHAPRRPFAVGLADPLEDRVPWRYIASEPVRMERQLLGWLCVADVRDREALDPASRQALRGLADVAEALLAARRPGLQFDEQALQRRQGLITRASHEMRTPLNAVLGFSQLLQLEPMLAETRALHWAQQIEQASRQLLGLVEEMLDLARLSGAERAAERAAERHRRGP